ncbi:MAG: DUF2029 domain-containing protein [Phycisphaerales bacterium]|nr:DUF2029 domain-containing protein [Phycisphaerales bacterium]
MADGHAIGAPSRSAAISRRVAAGFLIWLVASVGVISAWRGLNMKFDFQHFYLDAAYTWEHGALNPDLDNPEKTLRRQLPFYLPVVSLAIAPLAVGGPQTAALLWAALHVACLAYCLRCAAKHVIPSLRAAHPAPAAASRAESSIAESSAPPPLSAWVKTAAAALISLPAMYEAAKFNQVSFITLALVAAGVSAVLRRQPVRGSALLAAAAILKILPGIMLLWLIVRRDWRASAWFILWGLLLTFLPCIAAFGLKDTQRYHREWVDYNVQGAPARGLVDDALDEHFVDRRNQSIEIVAARWLMQGHAHRIGLSRFSLSEPTVMLLARTAKALLLLVLLAAGWRIGRAGGSRAAWSLAAAFMLGMLVFSPLLRQYYLIWAFPAVAALTAIALDARAARGIRTAGAAGLIVWLIGMTLWMLESARSAGAHLLMLIVIGAILLHIALQDARLSRTAMKEAGR